MDQQIIDRETLKGWTRASKTETVNAAIHPAGVDYEAYIASGKADAERIMEYVDPGEYVMDYGCGNGRVLQFIPNPKVGIDAVPMADWVVHPHDFHDNVDLVYSISVFIHNTYETGKNMLRWISDHVKPGGLLLLQIPIYEVHKDPHNWTDVGVWTEEQFREAAEMCGLDVVEVFTNPGAFSFEAIGANHAEFQILRKR